MKVVDINGSALKGGNTTNLFEALFVGLRRAVSLTYAVSGVDQEALLGRCETAP